MDAGPQTDEELAWVPQVMFTADILWDPAKVDDACKCNDWGDLPDRPPGRQLPLFRSRID
jgi:hypothetical protein